MPGVSPARRVPYASSGSMSVVPWKKVDWLLFLLIAERPSSPGTYRHEADNSPLAIEIDGMGDGSTPESIARYKLT